jgi:uncharacterized pyridoxamine 5'-phosphate oxidase family protein
MKQKEKMMLVNLNKKKIFIDLIILEKLLTMTAQRDIQEEYLRLRGQMLYVNEWKAIIYLATPV